MPVSKVTCPKCAAVTRMAGVLQAGQEVKCEKCALIFRVAPKKTALAGPARPTALASRQGKPTKLAGTAPTGPVVVCSKCSSKLRLPRPVPPGTGIRCPKCAGVIRVPPAAPPRPKSTTVAGSPPPVGPPRPKKTTLAAAKSPPPPPRQDKKTTLAAGPPPPAKQPLVAHITCPRCKVRLKLKGPPPVGKPIRCPACKKSFTIRPKQTALAGGPAKATRLAIDEIPSATVRQGRTKDGKVIRQTDCPRCQAVLRTISPLPLGKAIQCPKCARPFRLAGLKSPPTKLNLPPTQVSLPKVQAPVAKKLPVVKQPAPPRRPARMQAAAAPRTPWRILAAIVMIGLLLGIWLGLRWYLPSEIPEQDWETFVSQEGQCEVLMPGTPQLQTAHPQGADVIQAKNYFVARTNSRGMFGPLLGRVETGFFLSFAAYGSKASFDSLYPSERDFVVGKGTLLAERPLTLDGIPGKEFQVRPRSGDGLVIARFFLDGPNSRSYLAIAAGTHLQPGAGDAARFFDSFKIKRAIHGALPPSWAQLDLRDDQKQKVYHIQAEYGEQIARLEAQVKQLKAKESAELESFLTEAQKANLKKIAAD